MKKVSIIIPAYNAEKFIERCITSCVNQDYEATEVIVVDDGSSDSTIEICKQCEKNFPNLKVISKINSGVSDTRNYGIGKSTGDYVLFVDADDYIEKDMCTQLVQHMSDEIDMVVCGYYMESKENFQIRYVKEEKYYKRTDFVESLMTMQEENLLYVCWNKLFKREKIYELFPQDMTFGEDSVFNFKYLEGCNSIKTITYVGYHYNVGNENSAMNRYHSGMLKMIVKEFSIISCCLSRIDENRLFAQRHLVDNIFFFYLPQLLAASSINWKEKRKEFNKMSIKSEIREALTVYKYNGKRQKIVALAIYYKCFLMAFLMYRK